MVAPLVIVSGHSGSGKTVFAVNFALSLAREGLSAVIADMDIVNPYFCAREQQQLFINNGIEIILPAGGAHSDLPALSPRISAAILDQTRAVVLDVGGNEGGARVLARYNKEICARGYELFCCINARRPETATARRAIDYLRAIEKTSGLRVTGLVNTTHLLAETTAKTVFEGHALCREIRELCGVQTAYHAADAKIAGEISAVTGERVLPLSIYMNRPWEK